MPGEPCLCLQLARDHRVNTSNQQRESAAMLGRESASMALQRDRSVLRTRYYMPHFVIGLPSGRDLTLSPLGTE